MPFCAASVMAWAHGVPVSISMKTSGFFDASVVIGSVTVAACGSTNSTT